MNHAHTTNRITAVHAVGSAGLHLTWSDGTAVELDLTAVMQDRAFAALLDPTEFGSVAIGDWGHSVGWPSGAELGADTLWRETIRSLDRDGSDAASAAGVRPGSHPSPADNAPRTVMERQDHRS